MTEHRFAQIVEAYERALAGRDASQADVMELAPSIIAAVPFVTPQEIIAALRWDGERQLREPMPCNATATRNWETRVRTHSPATAPRPFDAHESRTPGGGGGSKSSGSGGERGTQSNAELVC